MIAEAIDTAYTIAAALLAWIAVAAAVASIMLLAGAAVGMWAVRGLWRAWRGHGAPRGVPGDSRDAETPPRPARGRSRPHVPAWAHSQPLDYDEAA